MRLAELMKQLALKKSTSPAAIFTSRLVVPSAMNWTEKSACVANLPRSHKHTRALPAADVMVLLLYCGWLWCCYYCYLASSSLVTCSEKTKNIKIEFLWIQKRTRTAVLVWLVKQNEKAKKKEKRKRNKERHKKQRKQITFGGFPDK